MNEVLELINQYGTLITLVLIVLVFILFITVIVCITSLNKVEKKYRRLMRGTNNKNLEELIIGYLDRIDEIKDTTNEVKNLCDYTTSLTNSCIQRVSIIRYKAFEDVGSDLSYSIALLDGYNNGVILTSIYARTESTTYAKPIDKGISRYDLSEEEEKVLYQAMNSQIKK